MTDTNDSIKDLSKDKLTRNVMSVEKSQVDMTTGEIISKENVVVKRLATQDEFIQFFVENISFVNTQLDSAEKSVLFAVIAKMDYGNTISINSSTRKNIIGRTGLSKATISRGIGGLIEKQVLLHINTTELKDKYKVFDDYSYLVNPNIVGKGSFRELKRLRQMVITDFNFDTLEAKSEIRRETFYEDYSNIKKNKDNYEVHSVEQSINDNKNIKNTDVTLIEKSKNKKLKQPQEQVLIEFENSNAASNTELDINVIMQFSGVLNNDISGNIKTIREQYSDKNSKGG